MSIRRSRTSRVIAVLAQHLATRVLVVFALGFVVTGHQATLNAQQAGAPTPAGTSVQASPAAPALSAEPLSGQYLINPGDVLEVYIYDVPELTRAYTVSSSGAVTIPLLPNPVQAAGLTPEQVARGLEEAFRQSGRLRRPEIAVSISKASIGGSIAVEGAVRNPLILPEVGRARLMDIITQCGGLTEDAGTALTITRGPLAMRELAAEGSGKTPTLNVELKKVMDVTDPASTIEVWPGDRISVEKAQPNVYYVLGEVRSPGGYTLKKGNEELTVLRALALAGDATGVAKKSKAMIIRKDPGGPQGREEIKLDLKSILVGKTPDPKLQADDILFVPGSNGKKALRTIENAPGMIAGDAGAALIIAH